MNRDQVLSIMCASKFVVMSTVSESHGPCAAVVGVAVTRDLELYLDTMTTTRKYKNLVRDPRVAFTFWQGSRTVQWEGLVDEPKGEALARLKEAYFDVFPDGPARETWDGIVYLRARPSWIRMSDFSTPDPILEEEIITPPR